MRFRILLPLVIGLLFAVGLSLEWPGLNGLGPDDHGTPRWRWPWREPPLLVSYLYLVLPLALGALAVATFESRRRAVTPLLLVALALGCFGYQLGGILAESSGLQRVSSIVRHPTSTGYFTDARKIRRLQPWLSRFDELDLRVHSAAHPPGPILYHYGFIRAVGRRSAPLVGGLCIGVIASLGVVLVYLLAGLWTRDPGSRLLAATLYSALPGLVLFFPQFDQIYPIFCMLMVILWEGGLRAGRWLALPLGMVLWLASFFAYNLLVVGIFMALSAVVFWWQAEDRRSALGRILWVGTVAIGVTLGGYLILFYATGFDPIASLERSLLWMETYHRRPHGPAVYLNLYDFALGAGYVPIVLAVSYLLRWSSIGSVERRGLTLSWVGALTVLAVNLSGLLDYETARVWLFLQPLVVVPAGLELARYPKSVRVATFLVYWVVLATIKCRLVFISGT